MLLPPASVEKRSSLVSKVCAWSEGGGGEDMAGVIVLCGCWALLVGIWDGIGGGEGGAAMRIK